MEKRNPIYDRYKSGTISLKDGREAWRVDVPAYVYDLWCPLIGTDVVGVYGMLCRLARDKKATLGIRELMHVCGKDSKTLRKILSILKTFGFLKMRTPNKEMRCKGIKTLYLLLDPPNRVTPTHIELAIQKGWAPQRQDWLYSPLVEWLIEDVDAGNEEPWDEITDFLTYTGEGVDALQMGSEGNIPLGCRSFPAKAWESSQNTDPSIDPYSDPLKDLADQKKSAQSRPEDGSPDKQFASIDLQEGVGNGKAAGTEHFKTRITHRCELVHTGSQKTNGATPQIDSETRRVHVDAEGNELPTEETWSALVKYVAKIMRDNRMKFTNLSPSHARLLDGKVTVRDERNILTDMPSPNDMYKTEPIYVEWVELEVTGLIMRTRNHSTKSKCGKIYQVNRDELIAKLRNYDEYLDFEARQRQQIALERERAERAAKAAHKDNGRQDATNMVW